MNLHFYTMLDLSTKISRHSLKGKNTRLLFVTRKDAGFKIFQKFISQTGRFVW